MNFYKRKDNEYVLHKFKKLLIDKVHINYHYNAIHVLSLIYYSNYQLIFIHNNNGLLKKWISNSLMGSYD